MLTDLPIDGAGLSALSSTGTPVSELREAVSAEKSEASSFSSKFTDSRIKTVLDFVDRSPVQSISIEDAAAVVFLSPSRFRHLFKDQVGMSFHAYLIRLRLERVRYLLQNSPLTITQIAEKLDIQDESHLMRAFKRTYGISPGAMRKLHSREAA